MLKKTEKTVQLSRTSKPKMDNPATLGDIMEKLMLLDRIETKLDNIHLRVEEVETRVASLENDHQVMAAAMDHVQSNTGFSERLAEKLHSAERKIEALENNSRRLNIRILGWKPQGEKDLVKQVSTLLNEQLELNSNGQPITVMSAYRILTLKMKQTREDGAKTIIATLQLHGQDNASQVIRQANQNLNIQRKSKQRGEQREKILITDDVCQTTRSKRQGLVPQMKKLRERGLLALIPFTTPARIVYKDGNGWHTEYSQD